MMTINAPDVAWIKAQSIYCKGDSGDLAGIRAAEHGYQPGTECYAAFMSGFLEMEREDFSSEL